MLPHEIWHWLILSFIFQQTKLYWDWKAKEKNGRRANLLSGLPFYQLYQNNIPFPQWYSANWGCQSQLDTVATLTFCWNQRMASSLRMRWLKPIRPVFRFLSAMLKPGLPRTWTWKQWSRWFIKANRYTRPLICAKHLRHIQRGRQLWLTQDSFHQTAAADPFSDEQTSSANHKIDF